MASGKFLIETERLLIREMQQSDFDALCRILCDEDVMRAAYESAFSPDAAEAAIACREYAFTVLDADSVCSMIRDTHIASQNVAVRNGMKIIDKAAKNFRNTKMNFFLYFAERTQ